MANYLSPEELAAKQVQNGKNNADSWRMGVQRTTKKPMERAKAAIPKMQKKFNEAITSGKVAAGFDSVSDAQWKAITVEKGEARYGPGLDAALETITEFQRQRKAYIDRTQGDIDAMPTNSDSESAAKMNANLVRMRKFKFMKRMKR